MTTKTITLVLAALSLALVGCSKAPSPTELCNQLAAAGAVTKCEEDADLSSPARNIRVADFFCASDLCVGFVNVYGTEAAFKLALASDPLRMEAMRAYNVQTRTIVVVNGTISANAAAKIHLLVEPLAQ